MRRGPPDARRCRNLLRAGCQIGSSDATERPVASVWSGSALTVRPTFSFDLPLIFALNGRYLEGRPAKIGQLRPVTSLE
jgi:hypothetical protein